MRDAPGQFPWPLTEPTVPVSSFDLQFHAGKTAQVSVESDTDQITVAPGIAITAPPTTSRDIKRHEASNYQSG